MPRITHDHRLKVLRAYGYYVGPRDPRLNTRYSGTWMVMEHATIAEAEAACDLPTESSANGPWCLVADDLRWLVQEAFDAISAFDGFETALEDVLRGGDGILQPTGAGATKRRN